MLNELKSFVKKRFVNDEHPAFTLAFYLVKDIYSRIVHKRHINMTYREIEAYISHQHKKIFGCSLDWDNPQTYNEKIHVSKVYMSSPLKTRLSDKYLVREWVREKIGEQYLVPLLGVYDSFDAIDFNALPDKFVIKCSHDSGSVTLVKDKSKINRKLLKRKYDIFMNRNFAYMCFEMNYRDIRPRILIEAYLGDAVNDYKFLCFESVPHYCWVDFDRFGDHKRNMYNMNWELQPFNQYHYGNYKGTVQCPECFNNMKDIAKTLCNGFGHVRVDMYVIDGYIYFGEMTFANGSGFEEITPSEYSYMLGELWPFDNTIRKKILSSRTKP